MTPGTVLRWPRPTDEPARGQDAHGIAVVRTDKTAYAALHAMLCVHVDVGPVVDEYDNLAFRPGPRSWGQPRAR
jgi:hypothetical protein